MYICSQPCFAEVEFPESNFVDHVQLLLNDPAEKEKFFQVCDLDTPNHLMSCPNYSPLNNLYVFVCFLGCFSY